MKYHETLTKQAIASLKMFAEDLPDEATALWIELHTNPGEEPCNSSDFEWEVTVKSSRLRTAEEMNALEMEFCSDLDAICSDERLKLEFTLKNKAKLRLLQNEEIEVSEDVPVSTASYCAGLSMGIKAAKLNHELSKIAERVKEDELLKSKLQLTIKLWLQIMLLQRMVPSAFPKSFKTQQGKKSLVSC